MGMQQSMLTRIRRSPFALRFYDGSEQTVEAGMLAVGRNGDALEFVAKQTPEICMAALECERRAEIYVKIDLEEDEAIAPSM